MGAVVKSATTTTKPKAKTKSAPVRDSWDDDDDDNDSENNDGDGEWNNEMKDANSATVWRDAYVSSPSSFKKKPIHKIPTNHLQQHQKHIHTHARTNPLKFKFILPRDTSSRSLRSAHANLATTKSAIFEFEFIVIGNRLWFNAEVVEGEGSGVYGGEGEDFRGGFW